MPWQRTGLVGNAWDIVPGTDTNNNGIAHIVCLDDGLRGTMGVLTMNSPGVGTWNIDGFLNTACTAVGSGDTDFEG